MKRGDLHTDPKGNAFAMTHVPGYRRRLGETVRLLLMLLVMTSSMPTSCRGFQPVTKATTGARRATARGIGGHRIFSSENDFQSSFAQLQLQQRASKDMIPLVALYESSNGDDGDKNDNNQAAAADDSFDGRGFANYLAPYALTLVASIVVTGLFVKFVLLDY